MPDLKFFNKEGYPYNFDWNSATERYEGKLMFDPNSTDTLKTIGIYLFENVPPKNITDENATFRNIEIYNTSGISYTPLTYSGETITNILKVNVADGFYSKWIFGDNFDKKFPKGTIINFNNLIFSTAGVGYTDYNLNYYTVLDVKPDAFLINTLTPNSAYTAVFDSGFVSSKNLISISDFSSGNTLTGTVCDYNMYPQKKLTVTGSIYNDGLYNLIKTGTTTSQFSLYNLTANTNQTISLQFTFYTERPKIYEGGINVLNWTGTTSGTTITFDKSLYSFIQEYGNLIDINETFNIIFEDYNDNPIFIGNPSFRVEEILYDETLLSNKELNLYRKINKTGTLYKNFNSKNPATINYDPTYLTGSTIYDQIPTKNRMYDYYIEYIDTSTTLLPNDIISLSSSTVTVLNNGKRLKILEVSGRTAYDLRYEYWYDYYSVSARTLSKSSAEFNNMTLEQFIEYMAKKSTDSDILATTDLTVRLKVEQIVVNEFETTYNTIKRTLKPDEIDTAICTPSISLYPTYTGWTGNSIAYLTTNQVTLTQKILSNTATTTDYSATFNSLNDNYENFLNSYGIKIYHMIYDNKDKLAIESIYNKNYNTDRYYDINVYVNDVLISAEAFSGMTVNHLPKVLLDIEGTLVKEYVYTYEKDKMTRNGSYAITFDLNDDNSHFGISVNINETTSYIPYHYIPTTGYTGATGHTGATATEQTLIDFCEKYLMLYNRSGIHISSNGHTLYITTLYPGINIFNLDIIVNKFSSYTIDTEISNNLHSITGNEIQLSNNAFDYELSTGMQIDIYGSFYSLNNNTYNIVGFGGQVTDYVNIIELSYQGPFFDDTYVVLSATTRQTLRKPRESYTKNFKYRCRFEEDKDEIFYYDFSGEQLEIDENYGYNLAWKYTGIKPLYDKNSPKTLFLNPNYNTDSKYLSDPKKQKTQFNKLYFALDQFDSTTSLNYVPEPMQIFLGYNSELEGTHNNVMIIEQVEDLIFSGITTPYEYFTMSAGTIEYITTSEFSFVDLGFEIGQNISLNFKDRAITGQTLFENTEIYRISALGSGSYTTGGQLYKMSVDTSNLTRPFKSYNTSASTSDFTTGFDFQIKVEPKTILYCPVYGETEGVDSRYDIALRNLGIKIPDTIEYIFKYSDINEEGIDYILLNQKRKEMLSIYPELWNYVGSYKALINAINFFGYNDLELYEYYRNIDVKSPLYQKLHKILIPDIFDNTVPGWNSYDYIKETYKNDKYKKTNLFNLTYRITDTEGNYVQTYSLEEAQYKLNGLKQWLVDNIVPLSANIVDITGVADVVNTMYQHNDVSNQVTKFTTERNTAGVNFLWQETYIQKGEYAFTIDFYNINNLNLSGWTVKIQTFSLSGATLIPQQYYKLMKNDYDSFNFTLNKNIDPYLYIETSWFNDDGMGIVHNEMKDTSTYQNYILINNTYHIPSDYNYLNNDGGYYTFDKNGYITIFNEYYLWELKETSNALPISAVECPDFSVTLINSGYTCGVGVTLVARISERNTPFTYRLYKQGSTALVFEPPLVTASTTGEVVLYEGAQTGTFIVTATKECDGFFKEQKSNKVVVNIDAPNIYELTSTSPVCSGGTVDIYCWIDDSPTTKAEKDTSYQLFKNGTIKVGNPIVGGNVIFYNIGDLNDGDYFTVVASGTCESTTSAQETITLIANDIVPFSATGETGCYGSTFLKINTNTDYTYGVTYVNDNGVSVYLENPNGIKGEFIGTGDVVSLTAATFLTSTTPIQPTSITYKITQYNTNCPNFRYTANTSAFADPTTNQGTAPSNWTLLSIPYCPSIKTINTISNDIINICTGNTLTAYIGNLQDSKTYYLMLRNYYDGTQSTGITVPVDQRPDATFTFTSPYRVAQVGIQYESNIGCYTLPIPLYYHYLINTVYPNPTITLDCSPPKLAIVVSPTYEWYTYKLYKNGIFLTETAVGSNGQSVTFNNIIQGYTYYVEGVLTDNPCPGTLNCNVDDYRSNSIYINQIKIQKQVSGSDVSIDIIVDYSGSTYHLYREEPGGVQQEITPSQFLHDSTSWQNFGTYGIGTQVFSNDTLYIESIIDGCRLRSNIVTI
jgi:hypothetical protein